MDGPSTSEHDLLAAAILRQGKYNLQLLLIEFLPSTISMLSPAARVTISNVI